MHVCAAAPAWRGAAEAGGVGGAARHPRARHRLRAAQAPHLQAGPAPDSSATSRRLRLSAAARAIVLRPAGAALGRTVPTRCGEGRQNSQGRVRCCAWALGDRSGHAPPRCVPPTRGSRPPPSRRTPNSAPLQAPDTRRSAWDARMAARPAGAVGVLFVALAFLSGKPPAGTSTAAASSGWWGAGGGRKLPSPVPWRPPPPLAPPLPPHRRPPHAHRRPLPAVAAAQAIPPAVQPGKGWCLTVSEDGLACVQW